MNFIEFFSLLWLCLQVTVIIGICLGIVAWVIFKVDDYLTILEFRKRIK